MDQELSEKNKRIVQEAFDTLFNKRDYESAKRFFSEEYIQHSAHIPPGRAGLFATLKSHVELSYEMDRAIAEGEIVMLRGRINHEPDQPSWIVVDTVRLEDGLLKEHWDVIEVEVSRDDSVSGLPMFGDTFPEERAVGA
jgi:predicted SnoaL-like aldol condensation-catalyzing enzyme